MVQAPLILNEREARRTRKALARIDETLSGPGFFNKSCFRVPPEVATMHRSALAGTKRVLTSMLNAYDQVQLGNFSDIAAKWSREPGVILIIARLSRGLSQFDLASKLGMREQQIQRYEFERYRSISLQNFRRIASVLGVEFSASIPTTIDPWITELANIESISISDRQLNTIVAHARRFNWFPISDNRADQHKAIRDLIHDGHVRYGSPGLLRTGLSALDLRNDALLAAWRARVVLRAEAAASSLKNIFDQLEISWLADLVKLSARPDGPILAINLAAEKGIIIIVEPQIEGLKLDGAAFLSGDTPIIGLTIRHDRIDNFWFTILHELAHVYLHFRTGLAHGFFDENIDCKNSDEMEQQADEFASSMLIPSERWRLSTARISRSPGPAEQFAKQLEIHPAIVFGRIRRERGDYRIFSDRVGSGSLRKLFYEPDRGE